MDVSNLVYSAAIMQALFKEPFVHFLALGALLFAGSAIFGGPADRDTEIEVSTPEVERLVKIMASEQNRMPNDLETQGLVAAHIREEVLYREAVRLGLDQGDTIIRRRLAQKMQFMINDLAEPELPSDAKLEAWFSSNTERFAEQETRSFTHIYFSPETHGDGIFAIAEQGLSSVKSGDNWEALGDPFMLQRQFGSLSQRDTSELFGPAFAKSVFGLDASGWHGPVGSAFGLHVVRIDAISDGAVPDFETVRAKVAQAWSDETRRKDNEKRITDLIDKYEITKEWEEQ